jgi:uncharacterized membrane protein YfcA
VTEVFLLIASAFLAGALNALAGGGSFLTFPALVFTGVPAVSANASSTVAMFPSALVSVIPYRHAMRQIEGVNLKIWFLVCLTGGLAGAILLLVTPDRTFRHVAPWLLLFATILFAFGKQVSEALRGLLHQSGFLILLLLFPIAVYGGYFGGGMGIMLLAAFRLYGMSNIHGMNGIKALLTGSLNAIAVIAFAIAHQIRWHPALLMMGAGILGGYCGAAFAKRIPARVIRGLVIVVGVVMTAYFFSKVS